jgi:hypothetical protein
MKWKAIASILALSGVSAAAPLPQPLTEIVDGTQCIFDGVNRYRVTWQVHHLAVNASTETYYVASGFPIDTNHPGYCPGQTGFGSGTGSFSVTYIASVNTDPCGPVDSSTFIASGPTVYDWDCDDFSAPASIQFSLDEIENLAETVKGINLGPDGGIIGPPGSPVCSTVAYTIVPDGYDFEIYAQATGTCAGGVQVLVGKGEYLTKGAEGSSCQACTFKWNGGLVDPDPPPPPPPPPPGGNPPNDDEPGDGNDGGGLTSGACCDLDGNCAEVVPADCIDGTFFPYQTCAETDCEGPAPPQIGACCAMDGETQYCVDSVTREQCLDLGPDSRFLGVGTFCMSDGSCPPYVDELCCELMITQLVAIRNRLDGWQSFFDDDVTTIIDHLANIADPDFQPPPDQDFADASWPEENWVPQTPGLIDALKQDTEETITIEKPDLPDSIKSLDVTDAETFTPILTLYYPTMPTWTGWVPDFGPWQSYDVDLSQATPMRNVVRWVGIMFAGMNGALIIWRSLERRG